jgi:hypothetical protein
MNSLSEGGVITPPPDGLWAPGCRYETDKQKNAAPDVSWRIGIRARC